METKILENSIVNYKTMFENQRGFEVASNINLDEIKEGETKQLKEWCFEMACTIVHVHYKLLKIEEFIEFYKKNEEVK